MAGVIQQFKKWLMDLCFKIYQKGLLVDADRIALRNPLIAFPFRMFVELELPLIYEKGGIRAAELAMADWLDKYLAQLDEVLAAAKAEWERKGWNQE